MARAFSNITWSSCALAGVLVATQARAQDPAPAEAPAAASSDAPAKPGDAPAKPEETPAGDAPGEAPAAADAKPAEGAAAWGPGGEAPADKGQADTIADAQAGNSAAELPGQTYRFVGARYRGIVVPKFMQNLFAEGGRTVYVHSFGPEFAFRKNGFEYNLGLWFGLYHMDDTAFKGKTDPEPAWEIISSKINIIYFTSDFLWSHEFSPEFALNYGVGAGFGIVFGDLHRNQSYPTSAGQDPNDYSKCDGVDSPLESGALGRYCDNDNNHFGNYLEPSWANGGSKPVIFPWLALQTGLRYKPSRSFVGRLDLGFGTSGFFFGIGADYGL